MANPLKSPKNKQKAPPMDRYKMGLAEMGENDIVEVPHGCIIAGAMISGSVWNIICLVPMPKTGGEEIKQSADIPPKP